MMSGPMNRGWGARPALLPHRQPPPWGSERAALADCLKHWAAYDAAPVDTVVTPLDDMLVDTPEGRDHYLATGQSALRLITDAMVLTGNTNPRRVLDLPCGGGRVTRHLVRFFPNADIAVSDIEPTKVEAVIAQFGVRAISASSDFMAPLPSSYDLIFVGSLVTHFDAPLFIRALNVLVDALAPGGVLILTTAGRNWAALACEQDQHAGRRMPHRWWSSALRVLSRGRLTASRALAMVAGDYRTSGFAYTEIRGWTRLYGQSYGGSLAAPSWLMRQVEDRPDAMVVGFKERGLSNLLDALLVQRVPLGNPNEDPGDSH